MFVLRVEGGARDMAYKALSRSVRGREDIERRNKSIKSEDGKQT